MKVLLIGNGINRYAGIVPGWDQLFAEAVKVDGFSVKQSISPTLEYELNTQTILDIDKTKNPGDIKRDIAAYLSDIQNSLSPGWEKKIHTALMAAAPDTILTTNYDYLLEYAADPNFKLGKASTRETLYSKERFRESGGHRIYHIHGEVAVPSSICLGFSHYVGSIQYIRSELTKAAVNKENHFHLYSVLKGLEDPVPNRWYYHFFKDDVYILGFSLDAAEQDIWWLLNYRAEQMRKHPGLITNTITYLETSSPDDLTPGTPDASVYNDTSKFDEYVQACVRHEKHKQFLDQKKTLLEAFHVKVQDCTALDDITTGADQSDIYAKRYQKALTHLQHSNEPLGCAI